ncbi:MAG TPA: glycosyl hydrolase family 39 [Puia sp.]|nr:glycosyl hydrolase family 39 [Puia sp.]
MLRIIFKKINRLSIAVILVIIFSLKIQAQENVVSVDWNKVEYISKTTPTLQVVENPMLRKNSPIHDATFAALKNLGADYVRYVPWFPYTKMAVAELKAPTKTETFWDFTYLDSTMNYFMQATEGHSVVINFSTTPAWMWKTDKEVKYPEDAYEVFWDYNPGAEMRDTTFKQIAAYYARVMSWYTLGGFTDELGKFHKSDHYYKIPYWEVLNEPDLEHNIPPKMYTKMYDAIVGELKKISPTTKFIGISLAFEGDPEWFEFFLNHKNHLPGIPLDGISYHHYSTPSFSGQKLDGYQYVFFEKAATFLDKVRYIENIRKRLSPKTITTINEIGTIIGSNTGEDIEPHYWNASGAMFAFMFVEMTKIGIDVSGESQLVGYPTQFPDVSMMDWKNGKPNARYWVLKLLKDNFGPHDKLVTTSFNGGDVFCQAYITSKGKKILLINERNKEVKINLPAETKNASVDLVDVDTKEDPPAHSQLSDTTITLKPFSVAVVQLN